MKTPSLLNVTTAPTTRVAVNLTSLNPKAPPVYKPIANVVNRQEALSISGGSSLKPMLQPRYSAGPGDGKCSALASYPPIRTTESRKGSAPVTAACFRRDAVQAKPIFALGVEKRPAPPVYHPVPARFAPAHCLQPKRSTPAPVVQRPIVQRLVVQRSIVQRMIGNLVESSYPSAEERKTLPTVCEDLPDTLVKLDEIIRWIATESKNQIDKAPMESFNFTCSIQNRGTIANVISRCAQQAAYRGSEMTHGLAWYGAGGNQANFNKYGPHITFSSPRMTNQSGETKYVAHHIYFLNGETQDVK